jgi:hypothetical protein
VVLLFCFSIFYQFVLGLFLFLSSFDILIIFLSDLFSKFPPLLVDLLFLFFLLNIFTIFLFHYFIYLFNFNYLGVSMNWVEFFRVKGCLIFFVWIYFNSGGKTADFK